VLGVLREMRPAVAINRNNRRVGKGVRRLDRIVGVHGEIERASCARAPGEEKDRTGTKTARHLSHTVIPNRVAGI
jgi:hypothetical protein